MSDDLFNDACWLMAAIMRGLIAFPEDTPGVGEVLQRIADQDLSAENFSAPQAQRVPACRHLPETVAAALVVSADLCSAIASLEDQLHWTRTSAYSDEAMGQPGYMDNYAYADVIGSTGMFRGDDFRLGLILLGPGLHYLNHSHAAPELYWLLTGPIEYRRAFSPFKTVGTASTIWNEPNDVHAMKTGARSMLAIWAWTKDVDQLPVLVSA